MNLPKFSTSFITKNMSGITTAITRNSPTILTAVGVAGTFTTALLGIQATPHAIELLEQRRNEKWDSLESEGVYSPDEAYESTVKVVSFQKGPLTEWERATAIAPAYVPAMLVGTVTITSIIFANKINLRRQAILMSAYQLADTKAKEWQMKVEEMFGEKKRTAVHDEIMKDHMDANPASQNQIIMTGQGDVLFYDDFSGRYFKSNIEKVRRVVAELNVRLTEDLYVPVNDFYWELGLDQTTMGDVNGWALEDMPISPIFSSHMSDLNEPCIAVAFNVAPRTEYYA